MLLKISNITCIILICIYASLINVKSRPSTNIGAFLIYNKNNGNNYGKNQKDYTLVMRYQKTIKKSASLVSINSI